jgi:glycosyltransferase involved in cell wall biosynthesis
VSGRTLHLVVPGSLEQRTGGSIYDRRMVDGLRRRDWSVGVHELAGAFPVADAPARAALIEALTGLPDGALVVVDFLVLAELPEVARSEARRLTLLALVHLLPADEPFLSPVERDRRRGLGRWALEAAAGVIATSPFTARRIAELGVDETHIRTVIPGTEPAPEATGPAPDAPPRLLCLASMTPGKGQAVLVDALGDLADVPWACVCAGSLTRDPAYAERVERAVRGSGLADRIIFPGACDAATADALYRSSSLFVLPSFFESYGMALTEAMAFGLPIVSTTAGAIPETVPAGAAILVPPGDGKALASALRSLLEDPPGAPGEARARRARLGATARDHASSLPDWPHAVDRFAEAVARLQAAAR